MRVAIDATVVRPPLSGVHYAVRHEALALLRQFPEAELCALATDPEIQEVAGERRVAVSPALRQVWRRVLWQQFSLPRLLKKQACEALAALAYTAPCHCPVPYALHVHDTIALRRPELCSRLNALHMRTLMPGSIRGAAHVLVSTPTVADDICKLFDITADCLHVLPLGVDPLFLGEAPRSELNIPGLGARPYWLFVGTIEPKKGVDTLLDAYAQVATDDGPALVLAGRIGWKTADLARRLREWTGPGAVLQLGYVDREALRTLYGEAQAVIMPSSEEGFGLPVLEAMAMGAPVVHSDHPVLRETAGGHGLTFPIGDAAALAEILRQLPANEDDRKAVARAARDYARQHTWDAWAQGFAAATGWL